jgi:hypothetical protein
MLSDLHVRFFHTFFGIFKLPFHSLHLTKGYITINMMYISKYKYTQIPRVMEVDDGPSYH